MGGEEADPAIGCDIIGVGTELRLTMDSLRPRGSEGGAGDEAACRACSETALTCSRTSHAGKASPTQ